MTRYYYYNYIKKYLKIIKKIINESNSKNFLKLTLKRDLPQPVAHFGPLISSPQQQTIFAIHQPYQPIYFLIKQKNVAKYFHCLNQILHNPLLPQH